MLWGVAQRFGACLAVVVGGLILGGPAHATTIGPVQTLAACPTQLVANADGTLRALTLHDKDGQAHSVTSSIDAAGRTTGQLLDLAVPWSPANSVWSVTSADGAITTAYETGRIAIPVLEPSLDVAVVSRRDDPNPAVSVATRRPDGSTHTQLLSDPRWSARFGDLVSRGGTTAVFFQQRAASSPTAQDWIAVRPAGSVDFLPPVSLSSRLRDRFSSDEVVIGPDGTGVVLSVPSDDVLPITARRIQRDGTVGPTTTVGTRRTVFATARPAVGPTGDIVVAIVETEHPALRGKAGIYASVLPAGGTTFSTPRLLGTERFLTDQIGDALAIAIDSQNRVTFVTGREYRRGTDRYDDGLQAYSGRGDQLVRGRVVAALGPDLPVLTPTEDGLVALAWSGHVLNYRSKNAQLVSFGRPDGTWSRPEPLSPPSTWHEGSYARKRVVVALPGRGIAMVHVIQRSGKPTTCALTRATP